MKRITSVLLLLFFLLTIAPASLRAEIAKARLESVMVQKKKYKGYKKPKSKKFLGIFKRKTDCGCPKH